EGGWPVFATRCAWSFFTAARACWVATWRWRWVAWCFAMMKVVAAAAVCTLAPVAYLSPELAFAARVISLAAEAAAPPLKGPGPLVSPGVTGVQLAKAM